MSKEGRRPDGKLFARKGKVYSTEGVHLFTLTKDVYWGDVLQVSNFEVGGLITEKPQDGDDIPPELAPFFFGDAPIALDHPLEAFIKEVIAEEEG